MREFSGIGFDSVESKISKRQGERLLNFFETENNKSGKLIDSKYAFTRRSTINLSYLLIDSRYYCQYQCRLNS